MNKPMAEQRVIKLAKKILPGAAKAHVTRQSDLVMDLNADSMSLVALVFAMEEEFGVGATELSGLVTDSRTIGDLVAAVERL